MAAVPPIPNTAVDAVNERLAAEGVAAGDSQTATAPSRSRLCLEMTDPFISAELAGQLVGRSARRIKQVADQEGWQRESRAVRGGIALYVRLQDVLAWNADDVVEGSGVRGQSSTLSAQTEGGSGETQEPTADPKAAARLALITPILKAKNGQRRALVEAAATEAGVSRATVFRWIKEAKGGGKLRDKRIGNRNAAKASPAVETLIHTLYGQRTSPTAAQVHRAYENCRKRQAAGLPPVASAPDLPVPELPQLSERSIHRIIRTCPPAYLAMRRGGDPARFVKKHFAAPIARDWSNVRVMECWMGDGTTFDANVVWPGYKNPIRPWLLAWMDVRSRMIVAWRLVDCVNGGTAMLALRDGWARYGLCKYLYLDNGKEYENKDSNGRAIKRGRIEIAHLDGYLAKIGVGKRNAWVRNPESKAQIERWFGTFSHSYLNLFNAYTGGNITAKSAQRDPERLKKDLAAGRVMTRDEAIELVTKIVAAYNGAPHSGLGGVSPYRLFSDLYARSADGVHEHPITHATPSVLNAVMMRRDRVFTISNAGVPVLGVTYHRDLHDTAACDAYTDAVGRKGVVAYDPDDLSTVHLYQIMNGQEHWVCDLRPEYGVDVTDEAAAKAAIREQQRQKKRVRQAAADIIDREVHPHAIEMLRAGALAVNDEAAHAEHEQRFVQGSGVRGQGSDAASLTPQASSPLLAFPKGGVPKQQPAAPKMRGLFGELK